GKITVHTATSWPFQVRRAVQGALGIPEEQVEVCPARIGLHQDGTLWYPALLACQAALGAYFCKRPVKLLLSRLEDFKYSPKRNASEIRIRSALGKDGGLLAGELRVQVDLGAYGVFAREILDQSCMGALGAYRQDRIRLEGTALCSPKPPAGPFGGLGMAQGFFAMERQASIIADGLGIDPLEWRKNNGGISRKKPLAIGCVPTDTPPLGEILEKAAGMADYHRKWASFQLLRELRRQEAAPGELRRGIGIASAYQGAGFLYHGAGRGNYCVELTLDKEGALEIRTSIVAAGGEYLDIWKRIAGEILGVETVRVLGGSTAGTPDSGPACLSRNIAVITRLVERACTAIRKQRFRDPLPIRVVRFSRPAKIPGWGGEEIDQNVLSRLSCGAAIVELELNPRDCLPRVRGIWLAVEGGRILAEAAARRTLKLQAVQALGWAAEEELDYVEGIIPDGPAETYAPLPPAGIPTINIEFLPSEAAPKGIGELPLSCIPAAYVQAVSQALDYPFREIPLSPGRIWAAIQGGAPS
ncbi:MAG: molybdopterin-dependent oxidoreductase, partial [Treponema sp.]|nr:molybdopterin-dependent oxidoreductase [Treponema sp.]